MRGLNISPNNRITKEGGGGKMLLRFSIGAPVTLSLSFRTVNEWERNYVCDLGLQMAAL